MKVLEEFQDVFTDVQCARFNKLGEHSITLTTEEPIHSTPYSLPHSMQKEGIREPSRSSDAVFVVIIHKPDELNKVCIDFSKLEKVTVSQLLRKEMRFWFCYQQIQISYYYNGKVHLKFLRR